MCKICVDFDSGDLSIREAAIQFLDRPPTAENEEHFGDFLDTLDDQTAEVVLNIVVTKGGYDVWAEEQCLDPEFDNEN